MKNNNITDYAQKSNYKVKGTYDIWVVKVQYQQQRVWPLGDMFPYSVFLYADGSLCFRGIKIGSLSRNSNGNYSVQINENTLAVVEEMGLPGEKEKEKEPIKESTVNNNDFEFSFRNYPTADEILNMK